MNLELLGHGRLSQVNSKLDDNISRVLMDKAAGRRNSVGRDGQILVGNEGSDKLRSEKNETTLAA